MHVMSFFGRFPEPGLPGVSRSRVRGPPARSLEEESTRSIYWGEQVWGVTSVFSSQSATGTIGSGEGHQHRGRVRTTQGVWQLKVYLCLVPDRNCVGAKEPQISGSCAEHWMGDSRPLSVCTTTTKHQNRGYYGENGY